jgi:sugar phosphate isomerase/epimerase
VPESAPRQNILWSSTVGTHSSLYEYVDAAVAVGMPQISLHADRFLTRETDSAARRAAAQYAAGHNVRVAVIDGLYCLVTGEESTEVEPTCSLTDALALAELVGATSLNVVGRYVRPGIGVETLAERFAAMCERAGQHGCRVLLEFLPYGGVADLQTAWQIVELSGAANGGVQLDTWHFFRSGPDVGLLARIPGDRIFAVQISDGTAEVVGTLENDTLHHRQLPGAGVFDLDMVVRTLARTGGLSLVGPEVLSDQMRAMPSAEAARAAVSSVDALLKRACSQAPATSAHHPWHDRRQDRASGR